MSNVCSAAFSYHMLLCWIDYLIECRTILYTIQLQTFAQFTGRLILEDFCQVYPPPQGILMRATNHTLFHLQMIKLPKIAAYNETHSLKCCVHVSAPQLSAIVKHHHALGLHTSGKNRNHTSLAQN